MEILAAVCFVVILFVPMMLAVLSGIFIYKTWNDLDRGDCGDASCGCHGPRRKQ
jgi:hypothetical protein